MIIIDLQQVMIANFMAQIGNHTNVALDENLFRHMVLNSIRGYNFRYRNEYGSIVIACDGRRQWRKTVFPYYKASRRENREKSEINWSELFEVLSKIKSELREFFPYRVVEVESAEADDVIGTIVQNFGNTSEPILIISGDKDFKQLQTYLNVKQFDPIRKRWLKENNPERYLKEHIIRGDLGDGIPNFLSKDDSIVLKTKQKSIMKAKVEKWVFMEPEEFCDENMLRNYRRNEQLIDLNMIPEKLKQDIMNTYESEAGKTGAKMFNYFIKYRLSNLITDINQFK